MKRLKKRFEFDSTVAGTDMSTYMANLLEKNEKQEVEIERGKLSVSILKQMHNRNRLLIDAAKFELKEMESKLRNANTELVMQ